MQSTKGKKRSPQPKASTKDEKATPDYFQEFQTKVSDFLKESQEKVAEAQKEFQEIVTDYQGEYQRSKEEEYRRMVAEVQEALGQEKSKELIQKAEEKYKANLEEKKEFIEKGIEDARAKFTKELEKVAAANKKKYTTAFEALLKGLKSEISGLSAKDADRETLAAIGTALIQTSQYAPVAG